MRIRSYSLAVAALALATAPAAADNHAKPADKPAAAMKMPAPAPEMAHLAIFDGAWKCEGVVPASPFGPGGKMQSSVKSHSDLGGFWRSGKVKGTMEGMPPFEGMFHITYDPVAKSYVMLWVDNMGAWSQSTSKGWEGDTIVYTGEGNMAGQKMMGRDTFTKNPDGSFNHAWAMQMDGKWVPMGEETCRKAESK